ncbi:hypothetical protein [Klebsiella pneumoniae]|uniref:hypothetical protein n=1 Tax=Klebsiella pneumoniae TaxID=573 RepID=UPI0039877838
MAQRVVLPLKFAVAVKGIGIAILTVKAVACGKIVVVSFGVQANSTLKRHRGDGSGEALDARRLAGGNDVYWMTADRPWRVLPGCTNEP